MDAMTLALSDRERWIHYFSVISAFGSAERIPTHQLFKLAETIRHERCRQLSTAEAFDIVEKIDDEMIHCKIALDDMLATLQEGESKYD